MSGLFEDLNKVAILPFKYAPTDTKFRYKNSFWIKKSFTDVVAYSFEDRSRGRTIYDEELIAIPKDSLTFYHRKNILEEFYA